MDVEIALCDLGSLKAHVVVVFLFIVAVGGGLSSCGYRQCGYIMVAVVLGV